MKADKIKTILLIVLSILFSTIAFSLSFTSNPTIDNSTQSYQDVSCSWNSSADTTQTNISWYNGSNLIISPTPIVSPPGLLSTTYTKRGEVWMCKVTITNGTSTLSKNKSITIQNSAPKNIRAYNESNDHDMTNFTILYEDTSYYFYVHAEDYDNDALTYSGTHLPSGTSVDPDNGAFIWTPDYFNKGYNNVTFWATDNKIPLVMIGFSFSMYVIEVNDTPQFTPSLSNKNATEKVLFEYTLTGSDEESDYPLNFSIIDDGELNGSDAKGLKIVKLSNTQAKLYFTPVYKDKGNHTIIINLSDTAGNWVTQNFTLTVIPVNQIPSLHIQNVSANQSNLFTMYVNSTDIDVNDTLNFSIQAIGCPYSNPWTITTLNSSASNAIGLINLTLTNDHIICRQVSINVSDSKQQNYSILTLNITNTNDAPAIHQNSSYAYNTAGNRDIHNLSVYAYSPFRYRINFSDIDSLTYEGETLTIKVSGFNNFTYSFSNSTGELSFTTNKTGTFYMNVNLSDDQGSWVNETLVINVYGNSPPIVESVNITINESDLWTYIINATDPESDTINYSIEFIEGAEIFTVNPSTGMINFTPSQEQIGNYIIRITATDSRGAEGYGILNITIINKNNPPELDNVTMPVFVVNHNFTIDITAYDKDLELNNSYENLTYWIEWISSTTGLSSLAGFEITKINNTFAQIINFMPTEDMIGNNRSATYNISIRVNDSYGLMDEYNLTFMIYNESADPIIINITPYGPPPTKFGWANTSAFLPNRYTRINLSEGMTITFNHTVSNEPDENMTYEWYYEGSLVSDDYAYTRYFDYSSASYGNTIKNLTLVVKDDMYGETYFSWIINITDLNRPVVRGTQGNNPETLNITGVVQYTHVEDYIAIHEITGVFYDPDDDINENGELDGSETNGLTFSANYCSGASDAVTISFENGGIKFTPTKEGTWTVYYNFTASDGYSEASSDCIKYGLEYTPETTPEEVVKIEYKTKTQPAFYQVEVDKIINLDILSPKAITLYDNNTAKIPITIKNEGKEIIKNINLYAYTSNEEVTMRFEQEYIEQLIVMEEFETYLYVESYRSQGSYEIEIVANATDPKFSDKAIVLVNSLEKERDEDAKNATVTKIAFAMDLLNSNTKCLDLNEVLLSIQKDIEDMDLEVADRKIDEVVNACRYLISDQTEINEESPSIIAFSMNKIRNNEKLIYIIFGLLISSLLGIGFSIYYTNKKEN